MFKVFGIKNCDTMKKTFKWLDEHKVDYEFVDLKKTPLSLDELSGISQLVGMDVLVNKRGMTWKKLGLKDKNLSDEELLQVLKDHQTMIKRPVIISEDNAILVGFDEDAISGFVLDEDGGQ